jgi:nucleotide-binding universal stress UspA family protein
MPQPTILCPVDFSDAGRGALRYAAVIATQFGAELIVLTVNHPLLASIVDSRSHEGQLDRSSLVEPQRFVANTFDQSGMPAGCSFVVATGKPAHEILRIARERACDLIVMSSQGRTGIRKLFFGTTTERVLRETAIPVLITPPASHGPVHLTEVAQAVRRVLVPVDLSNGSARHVAVAGDIARALDVPLLLAHVVEPLRYPAALEPTMPSINAELRAEADKALGDLASSVPAGVKREALSLYGDPAEEIAKIARDRDAGLIVVGLHGSPFLGPRMGSVTYRVLCLAHSLILGVPPTVALRDAWRTERAAASVAGA